MQRPGWTDGLADSPGNGHNKALSEPHGVGTGPETQNGAQVPLPGAVSHPGKKTATRLLLQVTQPERLDRDRAMPGAPALCITPEKLCRDNTPSHFRMQYTCGSGLKMTPAGKASRRNPYRPNHQKTALSIG